MVTAREIKKELEQVSREMADWKENGFITLVDGKPHVNDMVGIPLNSVFSCGEEIDEVVEYLADCLV